jgi:transposase
MAKLLVNDEVWSIVEPLLPAWKPNPKGGQPRKPDRLCLAGILFVLKTGIPWEDFPQEMGCCGMTLWNRLDEWIEAGVWPALHRALLAQLRDADAIDFSRVIVDSSSVRAVLGGIKPVRMPRIGARTARSITSSPTPTARRWRLSSPAPIVMTARN